MLTQSLRYVKESEEKKLRAKVNYVSHSHQ